MPNKPKTKIKPWQEVRVPFGRRKDNSSFYNGTKWRKTSIAFREANPFCVDCQNENKVGPSDVADHIRGLQYLIDNNIDPYDWKELQGLCNKHHNSKSGRQAHGYRG